MPAAQTKDKNPYGQIGDTIVLNPTTVVDARFGFNRIWTQTFAGNQSGFDSSLFTTRSACRRTSVPCSPSLARRP